MSSLEMQDLDEKNSKDNERRLKQEKSEKFAEATRGLVKEISTKGDLALQNEEAETEVIEVEGISVEETFRGALLFLFSLEVLIVFLYGFCAQMAYVENFNSIYQYFTGIEIMMFFGFGYLMTFLKRYGMGAVGFTMLITVVGLQWGILTENFFKQWYANEFGYIHVDIFTLIEGLFLVASILISYGAIIGKASPLQLVMMTFLEAIFYSINKAVLLLGVVDLIDAGGVINIHMFGAYFGLSVAFVLGKPPASADSEGGHISDLFSLIGTIFLWIYWPSFNGGVVELNSEAQQRALVGTVIALSASTIAAFLTSSFLSGSLKIRPVDIQNATLAGGVAVGAVCDLTLSPMDYLLMGFAGGAFSTLGFARLQDILDNWGIHDTCGIHNLHGIPSLIGGFASVILAGYKGPRGHDVGTIYVNNDQWKDQLFSILMTLGMAIVCGLFTGVVLLYLNPHHTSHTVYSDEPYWEIMDDFGRSTGLDHQQNMSEMKAGIEASRNLRAIVNKYATLGMDLSTHSMTRSRNGKREESPALVANNEDSTSRV